MPLLRIRQLLTFLCCAAWATAGLALPAIALPGLARPDGGDVLIALGCIALTIAFGLIRFEFQHEDQRVVLSADAGFVVLTALVLSAPFAALVGGVAAVREARQRGRPVEGVFVVLSAMLAAGAASMAARATFDAIGSHGPRAVLVAAIAAATMRASFLLVGHLLAAENQAADGSRELLRGLPVGPMLVLDAGLPTLSVAVAGPYLDTPALAVLVVLAGQTLTWLVLRLLHQWHLGKRAELALLDTFQRYVPAHVASAVLEQSGHVGTGFAPTALGDEAHRPPQHVAAATLAGELREVTVLFVDIRGFTAWSERTAPAEVFAELNRLVGGVAEAVIASGGTIDKFTGDGLMAFWNAPTDQPEHAILAVQALPRMLMRMRELNIRRETQRSAPLEIGVGVATGPAMIGNVGHRDRLAYTAIGDTVNLAARLEAATRAAGVSTLIDERTFLALPNGMQRQFTRLESIEVKGRSERVRAYTPTALAPAATVRPRASLVTTREEPAA